MEFPCKNYFCPWNFHTKFGHVHGISMCKLSLLMELCKNYSSPWNYRAWMPPSLEIPWKFPGNSRVNVPPPDLPLEI
jgi:hypothetical protein